MEQVLTPQLDYEAEIRSWLRRAPVIRRVLAHLGVERKLIAAFLGLLFLGLFGNCFLYAHLSDEMFDNLWASRRAIAARTAPTPGRTHLHSDIRITLQRTQKAILLCNALTALAAIPVTLLLVRRVFRPIRQLAVATDSIAAGDYSVRVAIHRPDTIGRLARSFNVMVQQVRAQQAQLQESNRRLAEANAELEGKVRQRTAQLETANRRLNFEIGEKEEFLRAISQDLSAPLLNISGMTGMLLQRKREAFDEEVIHRLERIQKNVEVESSLIAELLELSKIKTRRRRLRDVDLNHLLQDVAGAFEADLQAGGIRFVVDCRLPTLRCERTQLRQVFGNLVDNSIKYMGEGSRPAAHLPAAREIRVGCAMREGEVEFTVSDTGMGIDEEDHETIFHVFRRGRSPAVAAVPGKGLGLATVKSIVETYNGNLWLESKLGQGSTFHFTVNGRYLVGSRELAEAR